MDYEELHRKVTDLYLKGQVESGIQVGDTVRVTKTVHGFECGWACEWVLRMNDFLDHEYVVKEVCGSRGIKLEDDSGSSYTFPYWVLEKVEKPAEKEWHPCKFMPYDRVLVRNFDSEKWRTDIYGYAEIQRCGVPLYICLGGEWGQCISYEGNEHLNRTTGNPGE